MPDTITVVIAQPSGQVATGPGSVQVSFDGQGITGRTVPGPGNVICCFGEAGLAVRQVPQGPCGGGFKYFDDAFDTSFDQNAFQ